MSSLVENRAYCYGTRKSIHFLDTSWIKTKNWKIYKGYTSGETNQIKKLYLKVPVNTLWNEEDCDLQIEKYNLIKTLADRFNKRVSGTSINVTIPEKAVIDRTAGVHNLKGRRRSLSRDEWILAFENIGDSLNLFVRKDGTNCSNDFLAAFVHFTYHESRGQYIVSKLYGKRRGSCYTVSGLSLFDTDNDMARVMGNHKCNSICDGFLKPEHIRNSPLPSFPADERHTQPSAPPELDSESDEDVFISPRTTKCQEAQMTFEPQIENRNQFYVCDVTPLENFTMNFGPGCSEPPPYSSHCPEGHHVAVPCTQYGVNSYQQRWDTTADVLDFCDTATVQQSYLNSVGLS